MKQSNKESPKVTTDAALVTIISNNEDELAETEIAAEIIVPEEGCWRWVVVAASFTCLFILDGIFYTFGSIFNDMTEDIQIEVSLVALVNSVAVALYYLVGPIVSAFINRLGFRRSGMIGSIIISVSYFISHFAERYVVLFIFYGIIPGIGGCFIYMSSTLVVGFYFERLRGIAVAITGLGQSLGLTIMYYVNSNIVKLAGWRTLTLIHTALFGSIYFIVMTFRPLLSLTVIQREDTQAVTYLPSLATLAMKPSKSRLAASTATERLFKAVSGTHFPTAAEMLQSDGEDTTEPGPSNKSKQKITLKALEPDGGISPKQLKQYNSIMSRTSLKDKGPKIEITVNAPSHKKHNWCSWCFHWEKHVEESRPMYRDDAFYQGRIEDLPVYQKNMMETDPESKTGLEYQMAITRSVAVADIEDRKGVFTTAFRRILATMLDPTLLKRSSFIMVCTTGFLVHIGMLPMYVFLPDRNRNNGISDVHCDFFISTIGIANAIGRLVIGVLSCKFCPVRLFSLGYIMAGLSVMLSTVSYNAYYQYFCCILFGVSVACSTLRSPVLVNLFALEKLTNATGMLLMFQGFGTLLSTPVSTMLKNISGYDLSFYVAGAFIVSGGLVLSNVKRVVKSERKALAKKLIRKHSSVTKWKKKPKKVEILEPIPENDE